MLPNILSAQIRQGVADFLKTTFPATTPGFEGLIERLLDAPGAVFKGPYLSISLPFRNGKADGEYFPNAPLGAVPYAHQEKAFARLSAPIPQSTLVATGTGSGKTECFLLPILDYCRVQRQLGLKGIKAILIYPMNALASDQAERIARLIVGTPALTPVTAGLFVGEEPEEDKRSSTVRAYLDKNGNRQFTLVTDKQALRDNPPDILLTNYKMLDFLLLRQRDRKLWSQNAPETLRFLVVDELHSFDGAQGTDLACLIRRLKGRLGTPGGHLACVGTSATLGSDDPAGLVEYARSVFAEDFSGEAVITEDRYTLGEYLAGSDTTYFLGPAAADRQAMDPETYESPEAFLAAQFGLWFGETATPEQIRNAAWRVSLGERLKEHAAFQNLLRHIHKAGGQAARLDHLAQSLRRQMRDAGAGSPVFMELWLNSLCSLIAHARRRISLLDGRTRELEFLQIRLQLWLRELRRMVATVAERPELRFADDLSGEAEGVHLPVIHCRDCHVMGWGGVIKTGERQVMADLQGFYAHFFGERPGTAFIFPTRADLDQASKVFRRGRLCAQCGSLNDSRASRCGNCAAHELLAVEIAHNLKSIRSRAGSLTVAHHDCPYCGGRNSLTILGSQSASLSSVMIGQAFASRYNAEESGGASSRKKLIAFSDSVQDAAHRAGFFAARTWQLNFRPALAQAIAEFQTSRNRLPTLAELPGVFERRWRERLGDAAYVATFMPSDLAWLRDFEALLKTGELSPDSNILDILRKRMAFEIFGEFGQQAHVGRTLERTGVATVKLRDESAEYWTDASFSRLREEVGELRGLERDAVSRFLRGLAYHLRQQGALWQDFLRVYAERGCIRFVYQRNAIDAVLMRSPRVPIWLSLQAFENCDAVLAEEGQSWYEDWALKCFGETVTATLFFAQAVPDIYRIALDTAVKLDIFLAAEGAQGGVYALNPDQLDVALDGVTLVCGQCHHGLPIHDPAEWTGMPCQRRGCRGRYVRIAESGTYYKRLYQTAGIERIFAREHTGLLDRPVREALEKAFKATDPAPGRVNVLSATPTLEMGINIGDLSTVLLCSVPPAQSNYFQRIGRAGRSTGNSLTLTVANGRPHDLYFFADPLEMLAGSVATPGIFLNASAVLERQLAAYCIDQWVAEFGEGAKIPRILREVLSAARNHNGKKFPFTWFSFIASRQTVLLDGFIALFNADGRRELSDESVQWLTGFLEGNAGAEGSPSENLRPEAASVSLLPPGEGGPKGRMREKDRTVPGRHSRVTGHCDLSWKALSRLQEINQEIDRLKSRRERLEREIQRINGLPVRGNADVEEIRELEQERMALTRLIATIEGKDTFNFFTDEGLLPNYSFPEQGVLLKSIIYRNRRSGKEDVSDDREPPLTFEYERPAGSAITEFAPNNTFYAEGRRVVIDQVDVSRPEPEQWRFCRSCSYSESIETGDMNSTCPRCGDTQWPDSGRVRRMLKLRQVFAHTQDNRSRIADDSDERARGFFTRQVFVDHDPRAVREAYRIDYPPFPFGFEFLSRISFREVNFGEITGDDARMVIAGEDRPRPGFQVCKHCGTIQRRRRPGEESRNHALFCPSRKSADNGAISDFLFLYRQFESEAIRMLLPVSALGGIADRSLHSFIAAVQMGLIRRFSGSVDHLRVAQYRQQRPDVDEPLNFLVIYDSVPGGTGYLKELMRSPEPLLEVFALALDRLDGCGCNALPDKDGCYQCLFAYRNNFDRPNISRESAKRLLRQILEHRASLLKVEGIGDTDVSSLHESELERRFIEALRRQKVDGQAVSVKTDIVRGRPGYFLQVGERCWEIEPQVELNPSTGVSIPSLADFVFWPVAGTGQEPLLPIAVFTDGWRHHFDRVGMDMAQRMAIAKSGKFLAWSLTWDDVDRFLSSNSRSESEYSCLSEAFPIQGALDAGGLYQRLGVAGLMDFHTRDPLSQFTLLLGTLTPNVMHALARTLSLRLIARKRDEVFAVFERFWRTPEAEPLRLLTRFTVRPERELMGAWNDSGSGVMGIYSGVDRHALADANNACAGVLITLGQLERERDEDQRVWRQCLHAANLLLMSPCSWVIAGGSLPDLQWLDDAPVFRRSSEVSSNDRQWEEAAGLADPLVHDLLVELARLDAPIPEVGYELLDAAGLVIGQAELGWPKARVALLTDAAERSPFEQAGWLVFECGQGVAGGLNQAIILRTEQML